MSKINKEAERMIPKMKKLIALVLAGLMLLSLCACSSGNTTKDESPDNGNQSATQEEPNVLATEGPNVLATEGPNVLTTEGPNVLTTEGPNVLTTEGPNVLTTEGPNVLATEGPNVLTTEGPSVLTTDEPNVLATEENDPDYEAAQEFACLYITECAHVFINPLSVEVLKAWYWKDLINQYFFTFQLNVKNSAGITETVYYGTGLIGFDELTEQAAKDARNMTVFGVGNYFEENAIKAMQKGTELDAAEIQNYFLKNYK